jgi:hypothetical protein
MIFESNTDNFTPLKPRGRGRPKKDCSSEKSPYFQWRKHPNLVQALRTLTAQGKSPSEIAHLPEFSSVSAKVISNKLERLKRQERVGENCGTGSGGLSLSMTPSSDELEDCENHRPPLQGPSCTTPANDRHLVTFEAGMFSLSRDNKIIVGI